MKNKTVKVYKANTVGDDILKIAHMLNSRRMMNKDGSYTCCNIEVSEPKGTEVACPECKEWVTTR